MQIIIEHNAIVLKKLDEEIDLQLQTIQKEIQGDSLDRCLKDIEKELEKCEQNISEGKKKKLSRDVADYESKKIFRWQNQDLSTKSFQSTRSESISSLASSMGAQGSESDREIPTRSGPVTRYTNRKKALQASKHFRKERNGESDRNKVINLSSHTLTVAQIEVLEKGLTFSPSCSLDPFLATKDVHLFARKVLLKKFHHKNTLSDNSNTEGEQEALEALISLMEQNENISEVSNFPSDLFQKPKKFPPLNVCPAVEFFTKMVSRDIEKLAANKYKKFNLTYDQQKALGEMQKWDDVVFKAADKGGNLVIWPSEQYEIQAYKLLNDTNCYRRLPSNPLLVYKAELITILEEAVYEGILPKRVLETVSNLESKLPTFYIIPKIHKDPINPPGRPIVAGNDGPCEIICDTLDYFLKPLVASLPSYIRDTTSALQRLDNMYLTENMVMVTADVESLYTSIRHNDGIAATKWFLRMSSLDARLVDLLICLLEFILTHNCFIFNKKFYLQKQGTAMWASCAPSYANLFLGAWEREIFSSNPVPGSENIHHWMRYIDDVWFIWEGPRQELDLLMTRLNTNELNIKLTYKVGRELEFLDILIQTAPSGNLTTEVFRKPTATNTLLHATSLHPRATIKGIPTGQFLRLKRICSDNYSFEEQAKTMRQRFRDRGYNKKMIRDGYHRARHTPRNELLYKNKPKMEDKEGQIRLITTYNSQWVGFREIIDKYWPILLSDPTLKKCLPSKPLITARKCKNLKDLLVHSHYESQDKRNQTWLETKGCFPCGHCKGCANVLKSKEFINASGNRMYSIRHFITCSTKGVVYSAQCPCGKLYIGLTTRELRIRVREHVRDIDKAKTCEDPTQLKTIPRHFFQKHDCDESLLKVKGIDVVKMGPRGGDLAKNLAKLECKWIFRLGTMAPDGLNESFGFSAFL
ncbi:unnamed protein product [Ranitomeya imitator]|uniref:Helix-turn-helix domain-containing protein n=1 Tax=Ranitomeya imitator TaxID=111125 RepID=A0ABN9LHB1_9NEOB|nr:unnamed protein product [Ranitomeya imitator]